LSFDEREAARAGISNLTGETVRTKATCEHESQGPWCRGQPVDHEWGRLRYRWASGACSVPLPVPCTSSRNLDHGTTWSATLHGEPAWLFGAVHFTRGISAWAWHLDPAGLVPL